MAPVREPSSSTKGKSGRKDSKVTKRTRKVMTLSEKVILLDKLRCGMSYAACSREYGVNESTVRYIKKNEKEIRQAVINSAPTTAKVTQHVRDGIIIKTEKALNIWIEDLNRRHIPVDTNSIRDKAKSLYEHFSDGETNSKNNFLASKGWFENFKKRFSLHNLKTTGEAASADHAAAEAYPAEFSKRMKDKGYQPEQVFNADETGLWWKKMPSRTFISKEEKQAPGFKAQKDRVSLLLCGNAAGHMIKPMMLYRSKRPRALKGKDMNQLPVFYRHNKKAWMTGILFTDWFHNCFVPEVEKYLRAKGMEFKAVLTIDNCPGHPESLKFAHPNIEVIFLPKNTTSLIQPLDQGVIAVLKAKYVARNFAMIREDIEGGYNSDLRMWWKKFNIADCITLIKVCHEDLSVRCVNSCWKKLWPEAVNEFTGFPTADVEIEKIKRLSKIVGGEGLVDIQEREIQEELLGNAGEELTAHELEELMKEEEKEEEEEDASGNDSPQAWTLEKLGELSRAMQHVYSLMMSHDPSLDRSIKVKNGLEAAFVPYQEMLKEMKRERAQLPITMFFNKSKPSTSGNSNTPISPPCEHMDDESADDPPPASHLVS